MSPRASEPKGDFRYRHPIEVRYVDTDALGHINNATYLSYFEAARAGYHQAIIGSPFGTGEGSERFTFLIAEAHIRYRAPAFFGEPLVTECRVAWLSRSAFGLEYRVFSEGSGIAPARLVADGETAQVMYDIKAARVTRVPIELAERFATYEGRTIPPRPSVRRSARAG